MPLVLALFAFSWSSSSQAADQIALISPQRPSALVAETAIRVAAELRAAGFVVSEQDPSSWESQQADHFVGRIELHEHDGKIEILTSSGKSDDALRQTANPNDGVTTAEVVAVRAVESLRATLLQAVRNRALSDEEMTAAVQTFTGQDPQPAPSEELKPSPPVERPARPLAPPPPQRDPRPRSLRSTLAISPSFVSLGASNAFAGALEARALLHFEGPSIGIVAEGSVLPARSTTPEGKVATRHLLLMVRPGWVFSSARRFEFHLGVSAGLAQVYFNSSASQGATSRSVSHSSVVVQGDVAVARFWDNGLGAQVFGRFGSLMNAPVIVDEDSEQTFGRPLLSIGIGIAYRIPKTLEHQ